MTIYVVEKYNGEDSGDYSFIAAYMTFEGALKCVQSAYRDHVNEDNVAYYHYTIPNDKNAWSNIIHGLPDSNETNWFRVLCEYRLPWLTEDSRYMITKTDLIDV